MHYPILGYSNLISLQINSFSANIFRITDFRRFGRPQLGNNIIIRDSTSGPTLFGISLMNRRPCFSFEIKNRMAYRPCVVWNVCGPLIWLHSRCIRFHHMCQIFTRAITVITTRETKLSVGFDRMHGFCSIRSQWIFHNLPVPRSSDNGECRLPDNWIRFWIGASHFRSNAMLFVAAPSNWRGKCSPPEWCVCVCMRTDLIDSYDGRWRMCLNHMIDIAWNQLLIRFTIHFVSRMRCCLQSSVDHPIESVHGNFGIRNLTYALCPMFILFGPCRTVNNQIQTTAAAVALAFHAEFNFHRILNGFGVVKIWYFCQQPIHTAIAVALSVVWKENIFLRPNRPRPWRSQWWFNHCIDKPCLRANWVSDGCLTCDFWPISCSDEIELTPRRFGRCREFQAKWKQQWI